MKLARSRIVPENPFSAKNRMAPSRINAFRAPEVRRGLRTRRGGCSSPALLPLFGGRALAGAKRPLVPSLSDSSLIICSPVPPKYPRRNPLNLPRELASPRPYHVLSGSPVAPTAPFIWPSRNVIEALLTL